MTSVERSRDIIQNLVDFTCQNTHTSRTDNAEKYNHFLKTQPTDIVRKKELKDFKDLV